MHGPCPPPGPHGGPTVVHHIVCQHQIEIEVWPAEAEVYFRDERDVDPLNTQVRFRASVYNAPSSGVQWAVQSVSGGPGAGAIDATGLYVAPIKGALPHGTTDIVVATAADDPLRKAYARVTLIGFGPEPPPPPSLEVSPRRIYLYYPANQGSSHHNEFIDVSNKMQLFRATIRDSDVTGVQWFVDSGAGYALVAQPEPWYLYKASGSGSDGALVKIKAQLAGDPGVYDEARVVLINYTWPGIV